MGLSSRSLPAAAAVIFGLALVLLLAGAYPNVGFSIQGTTDPVVPVWEPSDEEQAKQRSREDTPKPSLSPTSAEPSTLEAPDMADDPLTSEAVETALRGPFGQEPKKPNEAAERDEPPRGAFGELAGRFASPVLPKVGSPSPESSSLGTMITYSQDPAQQPSPGPYAEATAQPVPTQASPTYSPMGTETLLEPASDLPAEAETTPEPTPADSVDAETFPQLPSHQSATPHDSPKEPPPLPEDLANLE